MVAVNMRPMAGSDSDVSRARGTRTQCARRRVLCAAMSSRSADVVVADGGLISETCGVIGLDPGTEPALSGVVTG